MSKWNLCFIMAFFFLAGCAQTPHQPPPARTPQLQMPVSVPAQSAPMLRVAIMSEPVKPVAPLLAAVDPLSVSAMVERALARQRLKQRTQAWTISDVDSSLISHRSKSRVSRRRIRGVSGSLEPVHIQSKEIALTAEEDASLVARSNTSKNDRKAKVNLAKLKEMKSVCLHSTVWWVRWNPELQKAHL